MVIDNRGAVQGDALSNKYLGMGMPGVAQQKQQQQQQQQQQKSSMMGGGPIIQPPQQLSAGSTASSGKEPVADAVMGEDAVGVKQQQQQPLPQQQQQQPQQLQPQQDPIKAQPVGEVPSIKYGALRR